jgi:hypothetical protein
MLPLLITLTAGAIGFILARSFVRRRLRFVDAVHSPVARALRNDDRNRRRLTP